MSPLQGEAKLKYMHQYYREHAEERKQYAKNYREQQKDKVRACKRRNYQSHRIEILIKEKARPRRREYMLEYGRAYRAINKEKIWAQGQARSAELKPICEKCGSSEHLDKHHPDYTKPLDVITVCRSCHIRIHRGLIT